MINSRWQNLGSWVLLLLLFEMLIVKSNLFPFFGWFHRQKINRLRNFDWKKCVKSLKCFQVLKLNIITTLAIIFQNRITEGRRWSKTQLPKKMIFFINFINFSIRKACIERRRRRRRSQYFNCRSKFTNKPFLFHSCVCVWMKFISHCNLLKCNLDQKRCVCRQSYFSKFL